MAFSPAKTTGVFSSVVCWPGTLFTGPLRSPLRIQNTFANESFMDELCARAGVPLLIVHVPQHDKFEPFPSLARWCDEAGVPVPFDSDDDDEEEEEEEE